MISHLLFIEAQDSLDNLSLISSLIYFPLVAYIPTIRFGYIRSSFRYS